MAIGSPWRNFKKKRTACTTCGIPLERFTRVKWARCFPCKKESKRLRGEVLRAKKKIAAQ